MSKSVSSVFGTGNGSTKSYESDIVNYLKNYDTSTVDKTVGNMENAAQNMSGNLSNMGNYNFAADGSDEARKRMEDSTYNSYMDRMTPQFKQQTDDMQTRLVNQGLAPGSEAYQRAMGDMQQQQNDATNQAAYQATQSGQNAFSQSLGDNINSGNFGNNAQQGYVNQILSLLGNSASGYEKNMDLYGIQSGINARKTNEINSGWQNLGSAAGAGASMYMASDSRLKENIIEVGKLKNGLTVYCYNYIGDDIPQIGLIAQEVQKVKPEAVIEGEDGYLRVNYALATMEG